MNCQPIDPCGLDDCDALAFVQALLPSGRLWHIGDGSTRPVFDGFWHSIAQVTAETSAAICAEWCEANPCTANRTIDQWAKLYDFPSDCVALSAAKLCEWINLVGCAGRCDFIARLVGFAGIGWVTVEVDAGCLATVDSAPKITIRGPASLMTATQGLLDGCDGLIVPEIECLRRRYFPAGVPVTYIPEG